MAIIVKSTVKEMAGNINVSSDFYNKLEEKVTALIKEAIERAKSNKRSTVMGKDV